MSDPSMETAVSRISQVIAKSDLEEKKAVRDCMKRKGFQYFVEEADGVSPIQLYLGTARDSENLEFRKSFGFAIVRYSEAFDFAAARLGRKPATRNDTYVGGLDAATRESYLRALRGSDSGSRSGNGPKASCQAATTPELVKAKRDQEVLFREAAQLVRSSGVRRRFTVWRDCMALRGQVVQDNPGRFIREFRSRLIQSTGPKAELLQTERAAALDDYTCRKQAKVAVAFEA